MKSGIGIVSAVVLGTLLCGCNGERQDECLSPLPVSRAPFERISAGRQPVKMIVAPLAYKTNLWDGVEFVSGEKRAIISGANGKYDCNHPLRFGRIYFASGRELVMRFWLSCSGGPGNLPEDKLTINREKNSATWSRPYKRPDGKKAVLSYTVTGNKNGTLTIDWDYGISLEEAMAQPKYLPIDSYISIPEDMVEKVPFMFGDVPHEMVSAEFIKSKKSTQWHYPIEDTSQRDFIISPDNEKYYFKMTFPKEWTKHARWFDFVGRMRDGKLERSAAVRFPGGDFRNNNKNKLLVKGSITVDFGETSKFKQEPTPKVGGLDFWEFDALHVPIMPSRNLLLNGSFEQDFKGWRWEDWGAEYTDGEQREKIIEGGKFGKHALLLRATQPKVPSLCSAPMSLEAGKPHVLSFWAKSTVTNRHIFFNARPCSVSQNGNLHVIRSGTPKFKSHMLMPGDWQRFKVPFTPDGGGVYVSLGAPWGTNGVGVVIDGIQVERAEEPTDFDEVPFVANVLSSDPDNDLVPGEKYDLSLDVQSFTQMQGEMRVRILNYYSETKFDKTFTLNGGRKIPLDIDPKKLGKGVFVVRFDYKVGGKEWSDYARFSVMKPLANKHATSQFYANHAWYERTSRGPHFAKKFVEWGWGATDGKKNYDQTKADIAKYVQKLGIRNYVHPVAYEINMLNNLATNLPSGRKCDYKKTPRVWTDGATPERLELFETAAYKLALECDPKDDIWTFWNEEEGWARTVSFETHFKFVQAVVRGTRKAFAERGLPPPKFCESHGTSHYFKGRNYKEIDQYLEVAKKNNFYYDVVTIHPYSNIDGGILGPHDTDVETQHLIDRMKYYGYPDSTPIMFTECFNMTAFRIPPWGANGWGDSYRCNTQPSFDRGLREFVQAGSQARLYLMALKFWPKVKLVHAWNQSPVLDIRMTPLSFVLSANTLGHLLPSPKFYGDAQPYGDVRGICFIQGDKAVMPVWTTNHDVEWGIKKSPVIKMTLPKDTKFIDLEGNERMPVEMRNVGYFDKNVEVAVPLTSAPIFLVSNDPAALLNALKSAIADDPATALSIDVKPTVRGDLMVNMSNKTKADQAGEVVLKTLTSERTLKYNIPPHGENEFALRRDKVDLMSLKSWEGRFSILPNTWKLKYFFVPKCGPVPNWSKIPAQELQTVKGHISSDLKASYKMAWNNEKLFVRVEVKDPNYISYTKTGHEFTPSSLYAHDGCLEVCFDGFGDARMQGTKEYDQNDSRYDFLEDKVHRLVAVNWQLAQGTASATEEEIRQKLERKFTRTKDGYVYEIAFAARYMAPVDLKAGTVAGVGICLHDWGFKDVKDKKKAPHGNLSNVTQKGFACDRKPYLWPLFVLIDQNAK
jgi:hypothetical protein